MNPLHALVTRGLSRAGNRTFGLNSPARRLNLTADALIALPADTAIRGLSITWKALLTVLPAKDDRRLGACADCGAPVTESDPFIRYRGDYYHAEGCAETHPPALTANRLRSRLPGPGADREGTR